MAGAPKLRATANSSSHAWLAGPVHYGTHAAFLLFTRSCSQWTVEKHVKKLMGERKVVFFPISIFFPHGPCCIWFPFSDSYGTEVHENDDIYPWLNVHSSACKFNDFVMNNPDNCSFNYFFFSSILLPSALLSLAIVGFIQVNTLLTTLHCFLEKPTIWWFTMLTRLWSILAF